MEIDRHALIAKFFAVLRNLNHSKDDILEVRKFFELLSEVRTYVPPTVEFMTVLKTYRPKLFQEFKTSLIPNSRMQMLATINFHIGQALINLGITDQAQLQQAIKGR
ncbi:hypothetical protein SD70_06300 [Gordoniibacillus kamchatkensis]|uniref:Uncharacterized protein n=1 Tax=Gordoniibacillus kamchatkensis TaxID=1590651 RepID=A0ABR5AKD7_9BACL|nr:hypothetical protein [Paenibacillus sp. VKM B-2647]KIL41492.1 hypothetical protein SD70_06300 [Paenibacillus sp. VKM B-2647]